MSDAGQAKPGLTADQKQNWLRLVRSRNVGPITFRRLINRYGSAETALAELPKLIKRHGNPRAIQIANQESIDQELERGETLGGHLIARGEPGYPKSLATVPTSPPLLWVMGCQDVTEKPIIAIVGSRNASAQGRTIARTIAQDLGTAGYAIVSGFAAGIDAAAHEGSMETGSIAALAGGLGVITPESNHKMIEPLKETGLFISERQPDAPPRATDYPARNRIISGSSLATLVVEANLRSGSLITAKIAKTQGRPVYAVPGTPLDPRAAGPNELIRKGAVLIRSAGDVIDALSIGQKPPETLDLFEAQDAYSALSGPASPVGEDLLAHIVDLIGSYAVTKDSLVRESGHSSAEVNAVLLELDIAGKINDTPDGRISLKT